jgi:hypothetical protein
MKVKYKDKKKIDYWLGPLVLRAPFSSNHRNHVATPLMDTL